MRILIIIMMLFIAAIPAFADGGGSGGGNTGGAAGGGNTTGGGSSGSRTCTANEWQQYCGIASTNGITCTYRNGTGQCTCNTSGMMFQHGRGCVSSGGGRLCQSGYYGTNGNCTPCPTADGFTIKSAGSTTGGNGGGPTQITHCYIPSGSTATDNTGTWTYTNDCHYSN